MTGISNLIHLGKEGIFITVGIKLLHILEMTACLTLDPEFIPAPAEIGHPAGGKGLFIGFFVHISYHQYLHRLFVLDHYRNMAIRIFLKLAPWNMIYDRYRCISHFFHIISSPWY